MIDYIQTIEKIENIDKWLLVKLATDATSKKDIYLRNSIAKSTTLLKSIYQVYSNDLYNEGWILFRALLDRLVYIYYLKDTNKFDEFEEWTFINKYEHTSNARSDERFKKVLVNNNFKINKEQTKIYYEYKKKNTKFVIPDAETVLKSKGLDFLYKFGYSFASGQTHPMSNDGEYEFYLLTGLEPNPYKTFDNKVLMNNSILIKTLIQNEIYNYLSCRFRGIMYSFLDQVQHYINGDKTDIDETYLEILKLIVIHISPYEKK
jgi:hypothetical protein